MTLARLSVVVSVALAAAVGCTIGAPERASDIQNPNAISDDISAVGMTRSDSLHAADPMQPTVLPYHYQVQQE